MRADAQILVGDRGPDLIRVGRAVRAACGSRRVPRPRPARCRRSGRGARRPSAPSRPATAAASAARRRRAPRRRPALGERVAVGPVGERRAGADCRDVHRVPGLVQQLVEVVEPAGAVGREHPRLRRLPARRSPPRARPPNVVNATGVFPSRGARSYCTPERVGVGAERPEDLRVERRQRSGGIRALRRAARARRRGSASPTARSDESGAPARHASSIATSQRSRVSASMPRARARIAAGSRPGSLARSAPTSWRYGLAGPPSAFMLRHTGSSERKSRRLSSRLSVRASAPSTVSRSIRWPSTITWCWAHP